MTIRTVVADVIIVTLFASLLAAAVFSKEMPNATPRSTVFMIAVTGLVLYIKWGQ